MLAVDPHDLGPGLLKAASVSLPEKVATASLPERDELSRYPDSDFGVVMLSSEGKLRKFACTSPEVAWLSAQYLERTWDQMPKTAAVVAGIKLMETMDEGGYTVPGLVAKVASAVPEIGSRDGMLMKVAGIAEAVVDIRAWEKQAFTLIEAGIVAGIPLGAGTVGAAAGFRKARQQGATKTETLKRTAGGAAKGAGGALLGIGAGYGAYAALDRHSRRKTAALDDRYPLDTEEQVKQAMAYFDEYGDRFHPADRREYCRNVKLAADHFEVEVTEKVAQYGGEQLNESFVLHLNARAGRVDERGGAILMKLATVATHQGPDAFGKALTQFDEHYGLSQEWDRSLPDPYRAALSEKTASEDAGYHWMKGIDKVTGADLLRLSRNDLGRVRDALGDDAADQFMAKPVTVFKSLPYPKQVVVARLAASRSHARGTISA